MFTTRVCVCFLLLVALTSGSTLTAPPLSALILGFESAYELSLLANTLSDQGIDATLLLPESTANNLYENLIDVEILKLNAERTASSYPEEQALKFCEALFLDHQLQQKIQEIQPTFTIFPTLRHDACLLPWIKSIESIPVPFTRNAYEEFYTFDRTGVALPILSNSWWTRTTSYLAWRSISSNIESAYVTPALEVAKKYLPNAKIHREDLYSDIRVVLWGADSVLRSDFASLTQMLVEIGCHHCRGPQPLPSDLQKAVIEHRLGTIVVILDESYETLIRDVARKLPQGRQGQLVLWKQAKSSEISETEIPENLFLWKNVDRQDLIGNARTRVVLSHCTDTEFLESAFHGTPTICFPRNAQESKNAARAVDLAFGHTLSGSSSRISADEIVALIGDIHEKSEYRENARQVSVAIRDRMNPPSDRLVYWLGYLARTKDNREKFLTAPTRAYTLSADIQYIMGLCTGAVLGVVLAGACVFLRYVLLQQRSTRSKGRYER